MVVNNRVHYQTISNGVKHDIGKATNKETRNIFKRHFISIRRSFILLVVLEESLLPNEVLPMYFHKEVYLLVGMIGFHDYNQLLLGCHVFDYCYIYVTEPSYTQW